MTIPRGWLPPFAPWPVVVALSACSTMTASSSFTPRADSHHRVGKAEGCTVRVVRISDSRMDPTIFGSVGGRTVRAPADVQAWLRSVLAGLQRFGIAVDFSDTSQPSDAVVASAELKVARVSSATTAKTGSVVVNMTYLDGDAVTKSVDYRGSVSAVNWASGRSEIQSMIDEAFDQVLAQAALDVKSVCRDSARRR